MRGTERRSGKGIWILAASAALLLTGSPSLADKMVLFKNGKVMRVQDVESKEGWTTLKLGKDGAMGVRNDQILGVEEAGDGKSGKDDPLPNQASVGGRGGPGGGGGVAANNYQPEPPPPPEIQESGEDDGQGVRPTRVIPGTRPINDQPRNRGFNRSRFGAGNNAAPNGLSGGRLNQLLQEKAVEQGSEAPIQGEEEDE